MLVKEILYSFTCNCGLSTQILQNIRGNVPVFQMTWLLKVSVAGKTGKHDDRTPATLTPLNVTVNPTTLKSDEKLKFQLSGEPVTPSRSCACILFS